MPDDWDSAAGQTHFAEDGCDPPHQQRTGLTHEDVIREISQKATGMVNRGELPHMVRLGRRQLTALEQAGPIGNTLAAAAPIIAPQIFTLPGEDNPASMLGNLSLKIERTADESHLEVL